MRSNWRFTILVLAAIMLPSCLGDLLGCQAADQDTQEQATKVVRTVAR